MHQMNGDGPSDRETLLKPTGQHPTHSNTDIDNFYEEIKEQQHQTALALGMNNNKGNRMKFLSSSQMFSLFSFKVTNQSHQFVIIMRYFIMNVRNKKHVACTFSCNRTCFSFI